MRSSAKSWIDGNWNDSGKSGASNSWPGSSTCTNTERALILAMHGFSMNLWYPVSGYNACKQFINQTLFPANRLIAQHDHCSTPTIFANVMDREEDRGRHPNVVNFPLYENTNRAASSSFDLIFLTKDTREKNRYINFVRWYPTVNSSLWRQQQIFNYRSWQRRRPGQRIAWLDTVIVKGWMMMNQKAGRRSRAQLRLIPRVEIRTAWLIINEVIMTLHLIKALDAWQSRSDQSSSQRPHWLELTFVECWR